MNSMNDFNSVANNFVRPESKDDIAWVGFIWENIIEYYNSLDNKTDFKNMSENQITEKIYFHLNNKKKFRRQVVVNSQPRTDNTQVEGYYDLKFQSNYWRENDIHYAIENKILNHTDTSIKEYTYSPNKTKGKGENKIFYDDGGMFRFLSNKYADGIPYGGMIAFVKDNDINNITDKLKDKIQELKIPDNNGYYGELHSPNSFDVKVLGFDYSFITKHTRKDNTDIELCHLFLVFHS